MKKPIILGIFVAIVIILLAIIPTAPIYKNLYGLTTVVVNVSTANDRVTCQDFNGNLWQFEGVEDWCVNDIATLIMDNNNTEEIKDDVILNARYGGYFEGWLEDTEESIFFDEDSL